MMRNRPIQVIVYFNEKEYRYLCSLCKETGLPKSNLIRYLIQGYKPPKAPSPDYPELIKELRAVGNNLNQLVKYTHIYGYINKTELKEILDKLWAVEEKVNTAFTIEK
jgi:hypothetical protein